MTAVQWEKICWKCRSKISIIIDLTRRLRSRAVHCSHGSLHMWWRDCTRGGLRLRNGTSIIINHVDRGVITSARTLHTVTSIDRKIRPQLGDKGGLSHIPGRGEGEIEEEVSSNCGREKAEKETRGTSPSVTWSSAILAWIRSPSESFSHGLAVLCASVCYSRQ